MVVVVVVGRRRSEGSSYLSRHEHELDSFCATEEAGVMERIGTLACVGFFFVGGGVFGCFVWIGVSALLGFFFFYFLNSVKKVDLV